MSDKYDKLVECKHCGSVLCYELTQGSVIFKGCVNCGFMTNNYLTENSNLLKTQMETLPELYKDVLYTDDEGFVWMPQFYKEEGKGMVYLGGSSVEDVSWVGVLDVKIPEDQRSNFPIPNKSGEFYKYKTDMTTLKNFGLNGFLEAMYYVTGEKL